MSSEASLLCAVVASAVPSITAAVVSGADVKPSASVFSDIVPELPELPELTLPVLLLPHAAREQIINNVINNIDIFYSFLSPIS